MNVIFSIWQIIINIAFLGLFSLGFLGSGKRILNLLVKDQRLNFGEDLLFSLGLGIGFFELAALFLGFVGLLYPSVFWSLMGVILISTRKEWLRWGEKLVGYLALGEFHRFLKRSSRWIKILIFLIFIRLLFNFLAAQAPVTEGDSLWYHLTLPKIFIRNHQITDVYLLASYLPFNTEMLYIWAMILKDEILAQSLSFLVGGVFLTTAVYLFWRNFFSQSLALLASLIFIFTPLISWESVTPKVELFWTFFTLLGFWAVMKWVNNRKGCWLTLAFILFGLGLGTKGVLGLLPLVALSPVFLAALGQTKGKMSLLFSFFFVGLISIGFLTPYLLRNFLLTGNPIFPLLPQFLGGGGLDSGVLAQIHGQIYERPTLFGFLKHLRDVSLFPQKFGPDIGPLYLVFLPVGIAVFSFSQKSKTVKFSVAFCLIFYLLWYLLSVHSIRYLLPIFPFLAIFIAATARYLIKLGGLARLSTITILVLYVPMSFLTYFWSLEPYGPKLKAAVGIYDRRTYLLRSLPYVEDFFWINENVSSSAKILLYLDSWQRTFYLDRPFILASNLQREIDFSRPENIKSEQEFLEALKQREVTHIYGQGVFLDDFPGNQDYPLRLLRSLQNPSSDRKYLQKIHQGKFGDVYQIIYL